MSGQQENMENMMLDLSIKEEEEVMTSPAQDPEKRQIVVIAYENVVYKMYADEL